MLRFLGIAFGLILAASAALAQSGGDIPDGIYNPSGSTSSSGGVPGRTRITAPNSFSTPAVTVFVDNAAGTDTANCGSATGAAACAGIQRAVEICASNYDFILGPGNNHTNLDNMFYRAGCEVKLANASQSNPYILTNPVTVDGLVQTAPITIHGDSTTPNNVWVKCNNILFGLTSQNGGNLILDGLTLTGVANCTYANALYDGLLSLKNIVCTPLPLAVGGPAIGGCAGAANTSSFQAIGPVTLLGYAQPTASYVAVFNTLDAGRMAIGPGGPVTIPTAINYGTMFGLQSFSNLAAEGNVVTFNGSGAAGSTGQTFNCTQFSKVDGPPVVGLGSSVANHTDSGCVINGIMEWPINGPILQAYVVVDQSVSSGAWTKVNLDAEFDSGAYWSGSTRKFTPLVGGRYEACWSGTGSGSFTAGNQVFAGVSKNGTAQAPFKYSGTMPPTVSGNTTTSACAQFSMNGSTDTLELDMNVTASAPIISGVDSGSNPRTFLTIKRISN